MIRDQSWQTVRGWQELQGSVDVESGDQTLTAAFNGKVTNGLSLENED